MVFPGNRLLQESRRSSSPACVILTAGDDLRSDRSPGSPVSRRRRPGQMAQKILESTAFRRLQWFQCDFSAQIAARNVVLPPLQCLAPIAGYGSIGRPILGWAGDGVPFYTDL